MIDMLIKTFLLQGVTMVLQLDARAENAFISRDHCQAVLLDRIELDVLKVVCILSALRGSRHGSSLLPPTSRDRWNQFPECQK